MSTKADERFPLQEMPDGNNSRTAHGNRGGPCRTANAPIQDIDKQGIKKDVENGTTHHNPHRFFRIARGSNQTSQIKGHGGHEHTGQHDVHILTSVGDGIGRSAEHGQYFIHEKIAASNEKKTKNKGEQHTIAQNILCPFVVFLAQNNRHSSRRTHANQRAKSVDDVHNRHRNGQASNGQGPHTLTQKHTVDNVVDRRNDLAHNRWQRINPQQPPDTFCL